MSQISENKINHDEKHGDYEQITYAQFLAKYSNADPKFVAEFFEVIKLVEDVYDSNKFTVGSEELRIFLGHTRPEKFINRLVQSYVKGKDYILDEKIVVKGGETLRFLLTTKCAMKMSLRSKAKNADKVFDFFITVNDTLRRYKDYIIVGLREKMERLKYNQRPKTYPNKNVVYILRCADDPDSLKIGSTENDAKRFYGYNSDKVNDTYPIFIYETDEAYRVDKCTRVILEKHRVRKYKEVYQVPLHIAISAIYQCDALLHNVSGELINLPKIAAMHPETNVYVSIDKYNTETNKIEDYGVFNSDLDDIEFGKELGYIVPTISSNESEESYISDDSDVFVPQINRKRHTTNYSPTSPWPINSR